MLVAVVLMAAGTVSLMPPGWSALCPPKTRLDEIVVCADREPALSPYRAPLPVLRDIGERGTASVSAERNKLLGPDIGTVGTCSGTWGRAVRMQV
jgi:hypothetical protein